MEKFESQLTSIKTKNIRISTVFSIALVLIMAGLFGLIFVHAKNLSNDVRENIVLSVILNDEMEEEDIFALKKHIDGNPYVFKTIFISKELAAHNLMNDLGEDFVEFLGHNPLFPSIDVYLKSDYANNESIEAFKNWLMKNPLVKEVAYQKSLIEIVDKNIRKISLVILSFAVLLFFLSITLIDNTIRLAIYSQRFLIRSMQLVGATKKFIRTPFIKYGIIHGFLASLIAIASLLLILYLLEQKIPEIEILNNWPEFTIVFAIDMGVGILISSLSTYLSVNKYLRLKSYNLYK